MCARFLSHLLLVYIGRVHGAISGCTVLWEVHPASAQNKSLISDTAYLKKNVSLFLCSIKSLYTLLSTAWGDPVYSTVRGKRGQFPGETYDDVYQ